MQINPDAIRTKNMLLFWEDIDTFDPIIWILTTF